MGPNPSIPSAFLAFFSFSLFLLLLSPAVTAHNITRLLENYPEFQNFSDLLNLTHLSEMINSRTSITILAVRDVSAASSKSLDIAKNILSTHIVLDYFDGYKLQRENKKSIMMTTLFQSSGIANGVQGFLNMTKGNGEIRFGSAARGSPIDSKLLRVVVAHPYNISVLEVSNLILAPGIDGNFTSPPPPRAPVSPPPPVEEEALNPEAEGPVVAESPEEEPADSPAPSDAPASSPSPSDQPADVETAEMDAPPPSSSSRLGFGSCGVVVVGLVSALVAF